MRGPFGPGVWFLGGGALMLSGLLLIGYLLPSDWEAEATAQLPVAPEVVFAFLDSPEGWQRWTPWPESGVQRTGPARGEGASLSWNDPELGAGSFTIATTSPPTSVAYAVVIGEGDMHAEGSVEVSPDGTGSRVTWRERGDFGWNPLMGYWALSMSRAQTDELTKGLDRLRELAVQAASDSAFDAMPDSVVPMPATALPTSP
jgi:hypothetical protein